jgi:voltage-gated potassium channel
VLRVPASAVIMATAYYLLPFGRTVTWGAITLLVIGVLALIVLIGFQVRTIVRSPFPNLRAVEALATSLPLFLLLFAGTYYVMARLAPGSFGGHLTRTDAMYFAVTVFTTVGFGDISAKTETAVHSRASDRGDRARSPSAPRRGVRRRRACGRST